MTQDKSNHFRPLPLVLMVIILAVVAVGGWWLKSRPVTPATAPDMPQITTPILKQPTTQQHAELTLYIPNDNAMLEKHTGEVAVEDSASYADLAKGAFAELVKKAPKNYPKGVELLDVKIGKDGTAILNFNSRFNDSSFWQGSSQTLMAIYSIVNTMTALPKNTFKAQQVRFLVEGKQIAVLGDFDTNDPLKPEMQWVQKN